MSQSSFTDLDIALDRIKEDPAKSFFIAGKKPSQLTIIRRRAYKKGIKVEIRFIAEDEIYHKPGTRVFYGGEIDQESPKKGE